MSRRKSTRPRQVPPELHQLEDVVGQFIEYWGFKKIHGRIWAHLYTAKKPLDAQELMDRLGVSKGLMSLALRDLLEHEVIENDHIGRHGTSFYRANPDLMRVITGVLRKREMTMLDAARTSCERLLRLKAEEIESADLKLERVQSILNMTTSAQGLLMTFLMSDSSDVGDFFSQIR